VAGWIASATFERDAMLSARGVAKGTPSGTFGLTHEGVPVAGTVGVGRLDGHERRRPRAATTFDKRKPSLVTRS